MFDFNIYADDTTLFTTIEIVVRTSADWLKVINYH